eukprot:656075-Prymnesium_polylepis.1
MDVLNERLDCCADAAYDSAAGVVAVLRPHPLDAFDKASVLRLPLAWCCLALQSKKPNAMRVFSTLCAAGKAIEACAAVVVAAVSRLGHGLTTSPSSVTQLLRTCLKQVAQHGRTSAAGCAGLACRIVHALSSLLSLDAAASEVAL